MSMSTTSTKPTTNHSRPRMSFEDEEAVVTAAAAVAAARRENFAPEDEMVSTIVIPTAAPPGTFTESNSTTTTYPLCTLQQLPGAFAIPGRPTGELPAWYTYNNRRNNNNNNNNQRTHQRRSSQSHIPPEMRIPRSIIASSSSRFVGLQSIRNIMFGGDRSQIATSSSQSSPPPTSSSRRRRSSIIRQRFSIVQRISDVSKFAGDAEVTTVEQQLDKIEEGEDDKRYTKEVWGVFIGILIVSCMAFGAVLLCY